MDPIDVRGEDIDTSEINEPWVAHESPLARSSEAFGSSESTSSSVELPVLSIVEAFEGDEPFGARTYG